MAELRVAALGTINTNYGVAAVIEEIQDSFQSKAAAVIQRVE
jgi:hypothetical protein